MTSVGVLLGFTIALTCSACLIVPVSMQTSLRPSLAGAAPALIIGVTTMEEVLFRFGEPDEVLDGEATVFRYRWRRTFSVGLLPLTRDRFTENLGIDLYTRHSESTLRIEFDRDAKVAAREVEQ